MTIASGTATQVELVALHTAVSKLEVALRQIRDGSGTPQRPGRFTSAQADALVTAVSQAITAVNA